MSFKYKVIDETADKKYKVWEHAEIRSECRTPGVYVLYDIAGDVLYIGKSGDGDIDKVGDRVYRHIHGTTKESKRGFKKRIFEIDIFTFDDSVNGRYNMNICENWAKMYYPQPIFSKDDFAYETENNHDYLAPRNEHTLWKNWDKHYDEGKEYQDKITKSGLEL
jgi:hypothetical protein